MQSFPRVLSLIGLASLLAGACSPSQVTNRCAGVQCTMGTRCNEQTGLCDSVAVDAGHGCTVDLDCVAPGRCLAAEGRCVGCLSDQDCAAGECDLAQHACVPVPDSCGTALRLDAAEGKVSVHGDTSRAANDTQVACAIAGSAGKDLVYSVRLTQRQRLVAKVTPEQGSGFRPVVSVRVTCSGASTSDLACAFPSVGQAAASFAIDALEPGTYFLWVDSEDGSSGAFTLDLTLETPPASDTCSQARQVLVEADPVTLIGDTRGLADDLSSACGGKGFADAVYQVALREPTRLDVSVESLSRDFLPVVSVQQGCPSGQPLGCSADPAQPHVDLPRLAAGTYTVVVDGQSGLRTEGAYRLTLTPLEPTPPATNDTCAGPQDLPLPPGGTGSVLAQSDTTGATDDTQACGGTGPDLVYALSLTEARQVVARVTPLAGSGLRPTVTMRPAAGCGSSLPIDQLACASAPQPGGAAAFTAPSVSAGDYVLIVDGAMGSQGPFELRVELSPPPAPPPNDHCPGTELLVGPSAVTVNGTTLSASDDLATCAQPPGGTSPDVVYALKLTEPHAVAIDLRAAGGSNLHPVAQLREQGACSAMSPTPELACAVSDPELPDRLAYWIPNLAAGTYPLWIEGDQGSRGPFTLRVVSSQPLAPPANDSCSAPSLPTLSAGTAVAGDTRAAANDEHGGGCGLPAGSQGELGRDLVWKVVLLSSAASITVTVTPESGLEGQLFRPVVMLRGPGTAACASASATKGCAVAPGYGQPVSLTVPNLTAGTYLVWVDGAGASSGKFTIRVQ